MEDFTKNAMSEWRFQELRRHYDEYPANEIIKECLDEIERLRKQVRFYNNALVSKRLDEIKE